MMFRKIRSLLLVVAGSVAIIAAAAGSGPHISFVDGHSAVNMGAMEKDTIATRDLKIVNTGDSALVISTIFSDCHCSKATFPREAIAPGDTAVIKVSFSSHRRLEGGFVKSMRIRSNADNSPTRFLIQGDIVYK